MPVSDDPNQYALGNRAKVGEEKHMKNEEEALKLLGNTLQGLQDYLKSNPDINTLDQSLTVHVHNIGVAVHWLIDEHRNRLKENEKNLKSIQVNTRWGVVILGVGVVGAFLGPALSELVLHFIQSQGWFWNFTR